MALNFISTKDVVNDGVKILVYSRSGVGKTTLCATGVSPFIISAESGLLSLRHHNIGGASVRTLKDLEDVYNWCIGSNEARVFNTLCVDSITEIGEVVLQNAKETYKDPRQAYGELIDVMIKKVKEFRDIKGKHIYVSAKETFYKEEVTGIIRYGPSMPGSKVGPALPYYFDEVFHLDIGVTEAGEKYRYLLTQPDLQYEAKDRSGALDPIEKPDLTHVCNKILNG